MKIVDQETRAALLAEYTEKARITVRGISDAIETAGEMLVSLFVFACGVFIFVGGAYGVIRFVKWAWEN